MSSNECALLYIKKTCQAKVVDLDKSIFYIVLLFLVGQTVFEKNRKKKLKKSELFSILKT